MVYLLKMVIFHGYVSHNQMVIFGCAVFFALSGWTFGLSMRAIPARNSCLTKSLLPSSIAIPKHEQPLPSETTQIFSSIFSPVLSPRERHATRRGPLKKQLPMAKAWGPGRYHWDFLSSLTYKTMIKSVSATKKEWQYWNIKNQKKYDSFLMATTNYDGYGWW